jgi:glyceraldehyde 3-phosphate dehydrogenase
LADRSIQYVDVKTASRLGALGVDLVIECSGRATTRPAAQEHINHGAKYVLISTAPKSLDDADAVLLPGINAEVLIRRRITLSAWQAAPPMRLPQW